MSAKNSQHETKLAASASLLISYCVCAVCTCQGFPCCALCHCVLHPQYIIFSFEKLLAAGFKLVKHLRLYLYCNKGNIEDEINLSLKEILI